MRLYANNAHSVLVESTDEVTTVIQIRPDDAARFPVPQEASDEFFTLTLWDGQQFEIVECFHNYLDGHLLVRRGMEGTSPLVFADGTAVRHGITAGVLDNIPQMEVIQPQLDSKAPLEHEHQTSDLTDVEIEPQNERPHGSMLSWINGKFQLITGIVSDLVSNASSAPGETVTEALENLFNAAGALEGSLGALASKDQVAQGDFAASAYTDIIEGIVDAICPAGVISVYPLASPPPGWLAANGQAVSRTSFPKLFQRYGTTFGAGNGTTTFNLPNLNDGRALVGVGSAVPELNSLMAKFGVANVTLTTSQIPSHQHDKGTLNIQNTDHTHNFNDEGVGNNVFTAGSIEAARPNSNVKVTGNPNGFNPTIAGDTGATGGGNSHTNVQPSTAVLVIIKAH